MTDLIVTGGERLVGEIRPSANKNAILPILCSTLLSQEPIRIRRVPEISDVKQIIEFFKKLGSVTSVDFDKEILDIHHANVNTDDGGVELPKGIRSSIMLVPPLLHRFGYARLSQDIKGCTLGAREIDPHIDVLVKFGAAVLRTEAGIEIFLRNGFHGVDHWLEYASVTATENFLMCAALAKGVSTLTNAACEPHVQEFCRFLEMMGADIDGIGTSRLTVRGVEGFSGGEVTLTEDFHEVTTFLALGAITGGAVKVQNSQPEHFPLIDRVFQKFGVNVVHSNGFSSVEVTQKLAVRQPFTSHILQRVEAAPWPYLSVDLLPIFVALGVQSEGCAMFWNKVYDGAFGWCGELSKFGAHVVLCDPHRLITFGGKPLTPAVVESPYIIRVAISLLMIAASIPGTSTILNATPIQRAHPRFVENLCSLGINAKWEDNGGEESAKRTAGMESLCDVRPQAVSQTAQQGK